MTDREAIKGLQNIVEYWTLNPHEQDCAKTNFLASWQPSERRDAGAAERTGLENRSGGTSTGGSNPPLSAKIQSLIHH